MVHICRALEVPLAPQTGICQGRLSVLRALVLYGKGARPRSTSNADFVVEKSDISCRTSPQTRPAHPPPGAPSSAGSLLPASSRCAPSSNFYVHPAAVGFQPWPSRLVPEVPGSGGRIAQLTIRRKLLQLCGAPKFLLQKDLAFHGGRLTRRRWLSAQFCRSRGT